MPRTIDPALDELLSAVITRPAYLMRMTPPAGGTPMLLCDTGQIINDMGTFTHMDFAISGVGSDAINVDMQNVDGAAGAFVLDATPLSDVLVSLWKFDRGAPDDIVAIGDYLPQSADVGIDRVKLSLRPRNLAYRFAPLKRVAPRDGFHHAVRAGEVLLWGSTRIIVSDRGN